MNDYRIRTSATDSVKGIPSTNFLDVQLTATSKNLPYPNVSTTLSQRSVYNQERDNGNKFRLILTIVPYCSNILFNPLTEITKNEGSDDVNVITDTNQADFKNNNEVYGKKEPYRFDMISNTEYSKPKHGYEYHPGYDFFDNHILRNKTFKNVNPIKKSDVTKYDETFNTLADFTRDRSGVTQKMSRRVSIESLAKSGGGKNRIDRHLYLVDDIMKIDESVNNNLYEDNGWWGFTNKSNIISTIWNDTKKRWEDMGINKPLNDHKSCEFIDMYPDRSLFSFTPKFNKHKHREENNWNVVVTYPYKNFYDHPICLGGSSYLRHIPISSGEYTDISVSEGGRWMGLKVGNVELGSAKVSSNTIMFRTYTKHGLKQQDMFYVYYTNPFVSEEAKYEDEDDLNGQAIYYESRTYYKVTGVGNSNRRFDDYYFYTSNLGLLEELYENWLTFVETKANQGGVAEAEIPLFEEYKTDDKKGIYDKNSQLKTSLLESIMSLTHFRIRRYSKGVKSTYYIRQLRKIPNLCAARRGMSDAEKQEIAKVNGAFDNYINENASDPNNPKYQRDVKRSQYQLAFAANIFNDNITQIAFTDGIDVEGLTDNLGRPLSELCYTIVKNNAGHESWYEDGVYNERQAREKYGDDYTIEFSHCFGKVTSGLGFHIEASDGAYADYFKKLSSINHIANIINNGKESTDFPIVEDDISNPLDNNITYKDTFFYGDLVEFNAADYQETKLADVMHRFNTAQRELLNNPNYSQYQYHEITSDDYDACLGCGEDGKSFNVSEYSAISGEVDEGRTINDWATIGRPEGYYYKAHYPIKIREYGRILQDSHYTMRIRSAKPVQQDGILIKVTTKLAHNLSDNELIYICDDESDTRYVTRCIQTIDKLTFLMSPDIYEVIENATDFEDREVVNGFTRDGSGNYVFTKRFNWLILCDILNGNLADDESYPELTLRRKNPNIPDFAVNMGGNRYIWRNLVNIGNEMAVNLDDYVFANGYFYITNAINFFLKRQDPEGNTKLFFDGEEHYPFFPNDPSGSTVDTDNNVAKEPKVQC